MKILSGKKTSDQRRIYFNQKHNHQLVFSVVMVFFIYMYFFSRLSQYMGLPTPQDIFEFLRLSQFLSFEPGEYIYPKLSAGNTNLFSGNQEKIILFSGLAITFITNYYSNVRIKKKVMVSSFLILMAILYELPILFAFLSFHLLIYLVYHSKSENSSIAAFLAAFFFVVSISYFENASYNILGGIVSGAIALYVFNKFIRILLLTDTIWVFRRSQLQFLFSHSVFIYIIASMISNSFFGTHWELSVGYLLFFLQWLRMLLYNADFQDGAVPDDLSLSEYMSVFFNPALLVNWGWGIIIGQSYQFQDRCYLNKDKNLIVKRGLKILVVAFTYFIIGPAVVDIVEYLMSLSGNQIYSSISNLLEAHSQSPVQSTSTVLASCLFHEIRYLFKFAGIFHFLVGIWRLLGYDMPNDINKPFLSTNLVSLWARLMYHFREFLVRLFYYPVFLKLNGYSKSFRVVIATMVAAGGANFIWGIIPQKLMYSEITLSLFLNQWKTLPYFMLLGAGISVTELYFLRYGRSKRKAWSMDWKIIIDVICVYMVFAYFTLINIFYYLPKVPSVSMSEAAGLFLTGLGLN